MDVTTLALLLSGAIIGVAVTETVIRRSDAGAVVVLGEILLNRSEITELAVQVGPVVIISRDWVFLLLSVAATARLLRAGHTTTAQRLILALAALVATSIVRGAALYGLPAALNESRSFLLLIAASLYFSTVEPRRDLFARIARIWMWAAAAFCALTVLRWAGNAVGLSGGVFGEMDSLRVIPAAAALLVGQAALIGVPAMRDVGAGLRRFMTPVLLAFVVLLQHRSVWIVVMVGLAYLLLRERAFTPRVIAALAVSIVVLATLSVTVLGGVEESLGDQLADSATDTATFEWRMDGWEALLRSSGPEGGFEAAFGRPFGTGWDRYVNGLLIIYSPHNYYLTTFLRVGFVGLGVLLGIYALALRRSPSTMPPSRRTVDSRLLLSRNVLVAIVGVQLVYFIPYGTDSAQAMLLGLACAAATRQRPPGERAYEDRVAELAT